MSHAFYYAGEAEEGIESALAYVREDLNLETVANPDVTVMRYGLLSVDDARSLSDFARQSPVSGSDKAMIIAAGRVFGEAQNALLKLFEEPPEHTHLFIILPSEGVVLPTLRSRMQPLPRSKKAENKIATEFLDATPAGREKIVEKILDRAKADKDEEKRLARIDARLLAEGLLVASYEHNKKSQSKELTAFLEDLDRFIPILNESSAPLKPIFEHLMITLPKDLVE